MLASIAMPGVLTVTTTADAHALNAASSPYMDVGNDISLRSAIEYLDSTAAGGYTIQFAPSLIALGPAEIDLTIGQIDIAESMTISGPGAHLLTIDQTTSGGARLFQVDATDTNSNAVIVSMSGLTLTGGNAGAGDGGAIDNLGGLTLMAMALSNNSSAGFGGAICNSGGSLTLINSTLSANAAGYGGGIYNYNNGSLALTSSTVAGNTAVTRGGALDNSAGTVTITGGTIAGNFSNVGAGINNHAGNTVKLANTIVAGNILTGTGGNDPDVAGSYATTDHNLIGELGDATGFSGNGNIIANTDNPAILGLGPLAGNGGPTQTMAPLPGGLALAAGNPSPAAPFAAPTTDQRGLPRVVNGQIDIGAYQTQSAPLTYSTTAAGNYTLKLVAGLLDLLDANGNLVGQSTDGTNAATVTNNSGGPMTLTVDYSGGDPLPAGGLNFVGGGSDTLRVTGFANGAAISETFTGSSSGSVQVGTGGAIAYSGLSPVLIDGGTPGNVNFTLPANAHAVLKDNGGGTPELVSTDTIPAFEATTFPLGTSSLTINGAGGDTITTDASFTGDFTGSLTINGTATDTVNLGALTLSNSGANLTVTGQTITVGGDVSTSGGQSYGGDVTLNGSIMLGAGSDVDFTGKVDGGGLDANVSGTLTFSKAVGSMSPLSSLTTEFSGATEINSGTVATDGPQTYNNAVTIGAATTLTAGSGGDIDFKQDVSGSFDLSTSTSGTTYFESGASSLASLTTGAAGRTEIYNGVTTTGVQTYQNPVGLDSPIPSALVTLSASSVNFQETVDGDSDLEINATGTTTFGGAVGDDTSLHSLTIGTGGATAINGGEIKTIGAQTFGNPVTLGANTSLFTTSAADVDFNGKLDSSTATPENLTITSGDDVNFNAPVGSVHPLGIVEIVSANNVTLGDTFAADKLILDSGTLVIARQLYAGASGTIIVQAAAIDVTANQNFGAGNVVFVTNSLTLNATLTGSGTIAFQAATAGDNIDINPVINGGGLNLTSTDIFNQLSGFSQIIIGASAATGIFTVDTATTLAIPVLFQQQSGGAGKVFINGTLTDTAALGAVPGITINGSGHTTTLNADMITAGTAIVINDSIILGSPNLITLDTTGGNTVPAGAAITITTPGTINDDFADTSALVLNGGTAGIVTLGGAIGSTTPIKSLSITGATIALNGGSIATAHDQTYTGAVVLGAATVLKSTGDNSTGGNITLTGAVDGGQTLTVTAGSGNVGFGDAVGTTPLASLTVSPGTGTTTLDANVSTVGAQDYGQAVVLGATLTLTTGLLAGDNITFEKTLDATTSGAQGLTVTAGAGNVNFDGSVGTTPLAGLAIAAGSGTTTLKANVSTTGAQNYGQAVVLGGTLVTLTTAEATGDDVTFAGTVDSDGTPRSLAVNAANVAFTGNVGTSPLTALTIHGSGTATLGGATAITVRTTGAQLFGEPVTLGNAAAIAGSQATFQNTIAGGGNTLVISGSAEFDNVATNLAALGVSGATAIDTSAITTTTGGQTYGGTVTLGANTVLAASGGSPVIFNASVVGANHSLEVNGDAVFGNAASDSVTGLTTLTVTGATTIDTGNISSTGAQTYQGAVTLGANTTVAGAGATFQSTIGGGGNSLLVNGNAEFDGVVTGLTTLEVTGAATINTGAITTSGSQSYDGNTTLGATTTLSTANSPVTFGGVLAGTQALTIAAGSGEIAFDGNVGAGTALGAITITGGGNVTAFGSIAADSFSQAAGGGTTAFDGNVTLSGAGGLQVAANLIDLQQIVVTAAQAVFSGPVELTGNAAIDTSAANGAITFNGTLDSDAIVTPRDLTLAAGTTTFGGFVGGAHSLRSLTTDAAGSTVFSIAGSTPATPAVTTTAAQTYNDAVTLSANTDLTAGGNVVFGNTVSGAFYLHASATGTTIFDNTVGLTPANYLTAITIDGASEVAANAINTTGNQTYTGPLVLAAGGTSIVSTAGGALTFGGTVTGVGNALTVTSDGTTTFNGNVSVNSLTATSTIGTTAFASTVSSVTSVGAQTYNDAVTLGAGATAFASSGNANITFGGTVTGTDNDLTVTSNGTATFDGNVSVKSLKAASATGTTAFGAAVASVTTVNAQTYNDAVTFAAAATTLASTGGADITFNGSVNGAVALEVDSLGNEIFNAPVGALTTLASLTTDGNAVMGAGGQVRFNAASSTATPSVTTTGAQIYIDAAQLGADTVLTTTGNGPITFAGTLDSDAVMPRNLTLSAGTGDITFDQNVGAIHPLNNLLIQSAGAVAFDGTLAVASITQLAGASFTFDQNVTVTGAAGVSVTAAAIDVQGITLQTTAPAAQVSLLGPVVLTGDAAITTAGGNVTFGGTLDSEANGGNTASEFYTLTVNAAAGNVTFQGAVGAATNGALGAIAVNSTGTTRFNSTVDAASLITDARGLTQLNGNVVTTGAQTYNDNVEVDAATLVLSTTNSPVFFAGTVNSAANGGNTASLSNALTVNAGSGAITFQGAVGGGMNGTLGAITANSGGTTRFNSTVNAAGLATDAGGLTQLNGNVTTTGAQTYGDNVEVDAAALVLSTTNSPVSFAGTIDSAANGGNTASLNNALTVSAGTGDVSFQQAVGGAANGVLGAIVVTSGGTTLFNAAVNAASVTTDAAGLTRLNGNVTTSGPQAYNDPVSLLSGVTTLTSSGGNISFAQTLDGASALTINTAGATIFNGAVGGNAPLASIATDSPGATAINGGSVTTSGAQSYGDNVTLGASTTTLVSTAGGNINFAQSLDGASALTVNTAGATIFGGAVGGTTPPVSILTDSPGMTAINGGAVTTRGTQTYSDNATLGAATTAIASLAGGNITFAQTLNGASALTVNTAGTTAFNGAVGNAAALTSLATDPAGATAINGGAVTTTAAQSYGDSVTLGAAATTLASTDGGNIAFAQTLDGTSALTVNTAGATVFGGIVGGNTALVSIATDSPGTTAINSGAATTSGAQSYGDKVILGAAATTLTSTGGGNIGFAQSLDGASALTVNTSGSTIFGGAVGGTTPLASVFTDSPGTTAINGAAVTTSGAQSYGDKATLGAAGTTLTSTGAGNISFAQTLDGASALAVNTAGASVFNGAVGGSTPLTGLTTAASGTTTINGGAVTTSGGQTYNDNVALGADTVFTATANGGIVFNGSLNSDATARNVAISTGGNVAFGDGNGNDAVGGVQPLATLTVSGKTTFNVAASTAFSPAVRTNGVQTYNGSVVLAADTVLATLESGNAVFHSTVDAASTGGQSLTIDTTGGRVAGAFGLTQFNANVGGGAALKSLTITTGGPFNVNNSVAIKTTGDINVVVAENNPGVAGDDVNVQSGGALRSSAGNVSLRAGDNITLAGSVTANGNIILQGDYNNNDPTPGTVINISSAMQAATVTISGGNGNDTINLTGAIQAATVTVNDGSGNDTINAQKTVSGTITTINAGSGGDTINISSLAPNTGGTLANIAGQVIVNGGAADVLNVYDDGDTNDSAKGDLTSTGLIGFGMGAGITYQGELESVNLRLGSGANLALNVHSTSAATPVFVVGQNAGTVNVGDNNQIAGVAGTLDVTGMKTLNINDQNSDRGQTYVITNDAVARPGTPLQALVLYHKVGTVEVNAGNQTGSQLVDDTLNLFLPTATDLPLSATLRFDGGTSPGGFHNTLNVIASQSSTPTGFTYHAHVGLFGGQDLIQVRNIQVLHMYGSPVDSNDFANDANVSSVIIGGLNADTLVGGLGQDILFGGGDTANAGDQLVGGGGGNLDFIFAEFRPRFNADGSVSFVQFPGSGNTVINAGGGAAVSLTPNTNINNASSVIQVNGRIDVVTWLTARFTSPSSTNSIFEQALSTDPVLSGLQAPPAGPAPVPVAPLGGPTPAPTIAQLTQYVKSVYQDVLGRAADPSSLDAAVNALAHGLSRGAFAASLTHSAEYYAANVVIPAYHNYLNRAPDAAGLAFWVNRLQSGLTDEQLEAGFISSDEFYATQGHGADAGWVDALYTKLLGRPADSAGKTYWLAQLAGGESRMHVALDFTTSLEREAQRVTYDYEHFLHRAPDQAGITYWVQQFAQGVTNEDLVTGFVSSDEYFADSLNGA